jgi:hypothetical protein
MGVRDEITNLLEMGSTIKGIKSGVVETIKSRDDWLEGATDTGRILCFGCKRMVISIEKSLGR